MPTRRIVPRNDGEGSIGKPAKQWGDVQAKKINGKTPSEFVAAETPREHSLDTHTAVTLAELNAVISDADLGPAYTLPVASADTLGGVKVAAPVTVTEGVLGVSAATTSTEGLMSAADKARLNAMANNANNYAHPNHTGDVISVADGATTIANDTVTNAKLANMATKTVKGRNDANTGDPEDLAMSTLKTMLGATTTPTASSIPIAGTGGTLATSWLPVATTSATGLMLVPTRLYTRSAKFARASANTISIPTVNVEVNGSLCSFAAGTIGLNTAGSWDASTYATPANRSGKDFYVYATADGLVLSANATYPTGYTAATSRKIGGFHCLCVAVGTISGHPLSGFLAGDILPTSVWDLNHRPICSPEGMVYSQTAGIWVDIYLQSGTGASTKSVNGGTITDTRTWMDFVDDLGAVGKRLLDDGEFQKIAAGGNEETDIAGKADPGTTTGHTDTAGRRMISNIGCEDCAGVMYQWLLDQSYQPRANATGTWYDLPGAKGNLYQLATDGKADVKLVAGGSWAVDTPCGSRCRSTNNYRWEAASHLGARGCCGAGLAG